MKKKLTVTFCVLVFSVLTGCGFLEIGVAVIVIPKLFSMSPKAIASEVGPAAGTWLKLQQAYTAETDMAGSNAQIGYTPPGASSPSNTSETEYFYYETGIASDKTAIWRATAKKNIGECKDGVWTVIYDADNMTIEGSVTGAGCEELTPNFKNIR